MKKLALSLVELVVSLAIILVVGSIVLVSFTLLGRRKLETAARNLIADLYSARQMAVSRNWNYIVEFDITNNSYSICEDQNRDGDCADSGERVIERRNLDVNITTSPNTLTFRSPGGTIGLNPSTADTILLEDGGKQREIRAYTQTGYVRLE